VLPPCQREKLARGPKDKEHAMSFKLDAAIATVIGIDIGKNSFHVVGQQRS
jgi:transposase